MKTRKLASGQIVSAMLKCGESRYAICKATGINQAILSRMLNHNGWMNRQTFDKLADHLGVEIVVRSKRKVG